jgi:5-oxoprolinase (ATP-hydrolysing) subunit A
MGALYQIDLNSDVGESYGAYTIGLDGEVIPLVSSVNIACGFHAGDPSVMRRTIATAKEHGVAVGAHPGFPDLLGFGRRNMDATMEEIRDYITYQIGALQGFAVSQGMKLQHVKAHGALYNMAAQDMRIAEAITESVAKFDKDLILVMLPGPKKDELREIGDRHGIRVAFEFFADRSYESDGTLVSRREQDAIIHDHQLAADRVFRMVTEGRIESRDGTEIEVESDTVCVHGDNPAAVRLIQQIRERLLSSGVVITPIGQLL